MLSDVARLTKGYLLWVDYSKYNNGRITQICPQYMGKNHGKCITITHDYDGNFVSGLSNYRYGVLHGIVETWYSFWQIKSMYYYKYGKPDGLHRDWYKNGKLSLKTFYIDGLKHGEETAWYPDGGIEYRRLSKRTKTIEGD